MAEATRQTLIKSGDANSQAITYVNPDVASSNGPLGDQGYLGVPSLFSQGEG